MESYGPSRPTGLHPLGQPLQRYGWSAALSGSIAAVGDEAALSDVPNNIRPGSVYVFEQDPNTDAWEETALLRPPPEIEGRSLIFGRGVDIVETDEGPLIFVSAAGVSPSGVVYVYRRDDAGGAWVLDSVIEPQNAIPGEGFGHKLSVVKATGGGVVVASVGRTSVLNGLYAAGAVYVFPPRRQAIGVGGDRKAGTEGAGLPRV